jgi:hypothetical protein
MDQPYSFLADWPSSAGASLFPMGTAPYSPFADWLSKFHTASEPIQALWIVALSATVLGVTWIVMRGLREMVRVVVGRHRIDGIFSNAVHESCRELPVYRDENGFGIIPAPSAPQRVESIRRGS